MSKRISYKVEGVVQGVNFRSWTMDKADDLKLTGFVKNASDGTVVGEAQGSSDAIDKFVSELNKGPGPAKVHKVQQEEISTKEGEKSFGHAS